MDSIVFRMDDVGASTKQFNQHGKTHWKIAQRHVPFTPFAHIGAFKRMKPFKKWGPYDELSPSQIVAIGDILRSYQANMTVAVTATWVDEQGRLNPFPKKFPAEFKEWKKLSDEGLIEIANHGLTHCIVGDHLPKFWDSNRSAHREFWPHLSQEWHTTHIQQSQKILEEAFECSITTLVPPGNVWSKKTINAISGTSLKRISCSTFASDIDEVDVLSVTFLKDKGHTVAFHDKEIQEEGVGWLENMLKENSEKKIMSVREYVEKT